MPIPNFLEDFEKESWRPPLAYRIRKENSVRVHGISSLKLLRAALIANRPRPVSGKLADRVHIMCGWLGFFSEEAPPELLEVIKIGDEETAIMELEVIAISIAARLWNNLLSSRRVVLFTDNESVSPHEKSAKRCWGVPPERE